MDQSPESPEPEPIPERPVAWAPPSHGGFAYVPGRVLVRGEDAYRHLNAVTQREHPRRVLGGREDAPQATWIVVEEVEDPLGVVALLRADGFDGQPDHVVFAHHGDCCCGPHPAVSFDAWEADPFRGTPFRGTPFRGTPFRGTPFRGTPFRGTAPQTSSARPAQDRSFPVRGLAGPGRHPRITVLDTGLADGAQRPALLADPRFEGDADAPDSTLTASSGTVTGPDAWLDPVAGHGTFIAGLIEQLAPGCAVRVGSVLSPLGDGAESEVLLAILAEAALPDGRRPDILSLSFGGTALAHAPALRSAIAYAQLRGIVVVASAGNDGSCTPQYPAAYDGVVAVGALGPDGPAPWTCWGDWVDACAPGTDLVSAFFADFDGRNPEVNTMDPDRFRGWATWSGTSFAAPVVVAAIAREMVLGHVDQRVAVQRVLHGPASLRIRGLGTVVTA